MVNMVNVRNPGKNVILYPDHIATIMCQAFMSVDITCESFGLYQAILPMAPSGQLHSYLFWDDDHFLTPGLLRFMVNLRIPTPRLQTTSKHSC